MLYRYNLYLLLICWTITGYAQSTYTADIRLYTMEHGLPDNHVYQSYQDQRGMIWILTQKGLSRFDGRHFKLIVKDRFNLDYTKNYITFEDDQHWLWIRIFRTNEQYDYLLVNTITEDILELKDRFPGTFPTKLIDINPGKKGAYWASTADGSIYHCTNRTKPKRIFQKPGAFIEIHAVDTLRNLIWFNDIKSSQGNSVALFMLNARGQVIFSKQVPFLLGGSLDRQGLFRVSCLDSLGILYPNGQLKQQAFSNYCPGFDPTKENWYGFRLAFDKQSENYWIIHLNQLVVFNQKDKIIYTTQGKKLTIKPTTAYSIMVDRQGIGWINTIEGLYKVKLNRQRFRKFLWQNPREVENPLLQSGRAIVSDEKTKKVYLNIWECLWSDQPNGPERLFCRTGALYGLINDGRGNLWLGAEDIYRHNLATKQTEWITRISKNEHSIAWSFFPKGDRLWVGLNNGLAYIDLTTQKLHLVEALRQHPVLQSAVIHSIVDAGENQLWLLTERGLFRYDPASGIKEHYWKGGKGKYYLPAENLRFHHQDETGTWWLATDSGLLSWNSQTGKKQLYTQDHGLSNNNIYAVYPDQYGFLWMSSDRGIIQFQKQTGKTRIFLPQDGITHQEFNRLSHYQSSDGTIYFGSLNGVTVFHPRDFYAEFQQTPDVPLILSSAHRFSRRDQTLNNVESQYIKSGYLSLRPHELYLTLRFALLDYLHTASIQYEYRITGLGAHWATCPGGVLQLAGLPYGRHRILVRAKMPNGLYSRQQLSIPIVVYRPFYLQWWFILLVAGLLIGVSSSFFRYRNHLLRIRKDELEKEVAIQTEKILADKTIIEQQAEQLIKLDEAKTRFFVNVTHELRTPLTLILGPIGTVLESTSLDERNEALLKMAQRHSQGLINIVNDLLDLSKLEAGRLSLQEKPILLYRKLRFLLSAFLTYAEQQGITFQFEYRAEPYLNIQLDDRIFTLIINNLLSNAFKFTETGGLVKVVVWEQENRLCIQVSDTGRGILPEDLPHIFDRFYQTQNQEAAFEGGTGIGLALAKESSRLMGGTLDVESTWGEGSRFTLSLPKKEIIGSLNTDDLSGIDELLKQQFISESSVQQEVAEPERPGPLQKIMVIEDHPDLQEYLVQLLKGKYQVLALQNGYLAQQMLLEWLPDLIISDIMMPVVDGFKLLEWLKANPAYTHIPVIMLTARADLSDKLRALQTGVDDYILKPFSEAELTTRIENLLQRQLQRQHYHQTQVDPAPVSANAGLKENDKRLLEQLEAVVMRNLSDPNFTVNDLAKELLMSRSVFYTEIGRLIGLTPNEYINEFRLKRAMEILKAEDSYLSTIKELARNVGFRDEKYFSRLFKQRYGVLPSQVKQI